MDKVFHMAGATHENLLAPIMVDDAWVDNRSSPVDRKSCSDCCLPLRTRLHWSNDSRPVWMTLKGWPVLWKGGAVSLANKNKLDKACSLHDADRVHLGIVHTHIAM